MTTSNQAISPKVLPAEISYALANIDRIEQALAALVNITAQTSPLLAQHMQQLQQEMQQSRLMVEAQYMDARMAGFGTLSLIENKGLPIPAGAASGKEVDVDDLIKFLTSRMFDIDQSHSFQIHSGLTVAGTVDEMHAKIRDERLPPIEPGIYANGPDQDHILPLRYKRNGLEVLTLAAWNPQQPHKVSISHHVMVPSEGGWLTDVRLKYFSPEEYKVAIVEQLAVQLQGQMLCASEYNKQVGEVTKLADEILATYPTSAKRINDLNDGGLRVVVDSLEIAHEEVPVGDEIRQEISDIRRTKNAQIHNSGGQLDYMPWTWRLSQLSQLRLDLHLLQSNLSSEAYLAENPPEAEEDEAEEE